MEEEEEEEEEESLFIADAGGTAQVCKVNYSFIPNNFESNPSQSPEMRCRRGRDITETCSETDKASEDQRGGVGFKGG